ncbi:hypothetical protein C3K47_02805 [Solitalea longa]|uniref:Uncharacterized protein n=1 Tax=Solitalea longa TaxID=2079460 RepID=A0A2S5A744_9SPHI|nr:hypothetical protein [Solitalea longa]POY38344.1 hypothetical protein C3K47_02805 [Solitalea longa]
MNFNDLEKNLPQPEQTSPFTVPENYFNSLNDRIWERIKMEDAGLNIEGLTNENPFKLPETYFENLSSKIKDQLDTGDEEDVHLSIPGLNNINPFTAPTDYFDELPTTIEERVFSEIADIELENANQTFIRRFYRLAIAACFTALASWFGYNIYQVNQLDKQMNSTANVVKIDNQNFDLNYFDESMLVEEVVNTSAGNAAVNPSAEKTRKLENYILNNVDEELLLQEL